MPSATSVMITGANVGLGFDAARQLAFVPSIRRIVLACRNPEKAKAAKKELIKLTGKKSLFEICIMDVSNLDSVRAAVDKLEGTIDGLIMNAGGIGGKDPAAMTEYGVPAIVAVNILGHVLLVDLLLEQRKISSKASVVFSGTEASRGIPLMGMKQYKFEKGGSVEEFTSMVNGKVYKSAKFDTIYGPTKMVGTLWMASMARKYPSMRFLTMSPGGTKGTTFDRDMSPPERFMMKKVMFPALSCMGKIHDLDVGAKRYVDALLDDSYESGVFYASEKGMTGKTTDQIIYADYLHSKTYQDNANIALHKFLPTAVPTGA